MVYDLFTKEKAVIDTAKTFLKGEAITEEQAQAQFKALLSAYEKLFKTIRRLMRLSDRNEVELNKVAKSLSEKNKMLEVLSNKLAKYLSPQVYESIFSGKSDVTLATNRKKLTVFFSDIKDFTDTTDDLEPEDLTLLLNDYLTEMSDIAFEYGGTIDKFIGDAILIFFGDPETKGLKEDALACVRMAVAMQRRLVDLRAKWHDLGLRRGFHKRIGINTGYCNVGNFGSQNRMEYTIIGGEVNITARMEGIAEPDGITLTAETYALVKDHFDAVALEPVQVKGIARDIHPFALRGVLDDEDAEKRVIRVDDEAFRIFVDLTRLVDKAEREGAAQQLDELASRLRQA
jgi:class 3 adenylate cyclase